MGLYNKGKKRMEGKIQINERIEENKLKNKEWKIKVTQWKEYTFANYSKYNMNNSINFSVKK